MKLAQKWNKGGDVAALALVIAVGAMTYGWIAMGGVRWIDFTDSLDYLRLADFFHGRTPGEASDAFYRETRFPPLFPLLLALVGAGTHHLHLADIVSNALAVLAAVALWSWVRIERGRWQATLVALGLLLYPGYFLLNLTPVSEPLGMVFLYATFALLARPDPVRHRVLTAALIVGASPLVRTALLPLIPAFVLWLWLRRPLTKPMLLAAVLLATFPFAAWTGYRSLLGSESYAQYLTWGAGLPAFLARQPMQLFVQFVQNWGMSSSGLTVAASILLCMLGFFGCVIRLREQRPDAWFLIGYLAMILFWPFPSQLGRFLVFVHPILLLCVLTALARLSRRHEKTSATKSPHAAPFAFAILIALATAPAAIRFFHRASLPVAPALAGEKRMKDFLTADDDERAVANAEIYARLRLAAQEMGELIEPGQCVYSLFPKSITLYGNFHAVRFPPTLDPGISAERVLTECDYYFIGGIHWSTDGLRYPPLFPRKALEGWTQPVFVSRAAYPDGRIIAAAALARRMR